jgi:hypothetical protein
VVGAGLDVGRVSSALGVAFAIGTLILVLRFSRRLGIPPIAGWLAALFLAVDGSFALWSVSGLETPLFVFLVTLGAFAYVGENFKPGQSGSPEGGKVWSSATSGLVFALAAMTRPEAGAIFVMTAAHQAGWRLLNERRFVTRSDLGRIGAFVLLFVPYWLVRWRYYHSFLPNSFYAKVSVGGPLAQIERGLNHVEQFVGVHLGWLILVPAGIALLGVTIRYLNTRRQAEAAAEVERAFLGFSYFAALVLLYAAYIVYVGGDWSVGRFFVPILPVTYLLIGTGLTWSVALVVRNAQTASWVTAVVGISLAAALWFASAYNGEFRIFIGGFDAARATEARITAGKWLHDHVPPGTWIAVDAAGQVPYFSELPAIDMFGINDLHIGRMPVATLGQGTPGHEKFDLGYIIARAPKYVVIYGTLFDSVTEYRRAPLQWTNDPELEKFLTIYERVR